jgi:hypothetical protein
MEVESSRRESHISSFLPVDPFPISPLTTARNHLLNCGTYLLMGYYNEKAATLSTFFSAFWDIANIESETFCEELIMSSIDYGCMYCQHA